MKNNPIKMKIQTALVTNSMSRSPSRYGLFLIPLMLAAFALSPTAQAQLSPPPDGGYGGDNTAEGTDALFSLTTGTDNTAIGFNALFSNTTGDSNTATGSQALVSNSTGVRNTANGFAALNSNTTGEMNTATGRAALVNNTTGNHNTATGYFALFSSTTGDSNTADGYDALVNNTTGADNIALGNFAGGNLTTGDNNIDLGNLGVAAEANTIRIGTQGTQTNAYLAGIYQTNIARGLVVKVDSDGHLGTVGSSERFKDEIKPMNKASEAILGLKPVTFHYKKELDPERTPQFGLVAEEVEKVNPDLVVRDKEGKPYTVRYDAVNAMLLNEFLKEHCKVEEQSANITQLESAAVKQEATIAQQRRDFEANTAQQQREIQVLTASLTEQAAQIQKVSAQLELSKTAQEIVLLHQ